MLPAETNMSEAIISKPFWREFYLRKKTASKKAGGPINIKKEIYTLFLRSPLEFLRSKRPLLFYY